MPEPDDAPDLESLRITSQHPVGPGNPVTEPTIDLDQVTEPDDAEEFPPAIRDWIAELDAQPATREVFARAVAPYTAPLQTTIAGMLAPHTAPLQTTIAGMLASHAAPLQITIASAVAPHAAQIGAAAAARPLLDVHAATALSVLAQYDFHAVMRERLLPLLDSQAAWRSIGFRLAGDTGWLASALPKLTVVASIGMQPWMTDLVGTIEPMLQLRQLTADIGAAYTGPLAAMVDSFYPKIGWRFADVLQQIGERVRSATADPDEACLFAEALRARAAVLSTLESGPVVREFAKRWLRLRNVDEPMLDAVVNALLSDGWSDTDMTDGELRQHLRRVTIAEHRLTRPIGERRLGRERIGSLSTTVRTDTGRIMLAEVLPAPGELEAEALDRLGGQWEDPRLQRLCRQLGARGAVVFEALSSELGLTWRDAAELAGNPPELGETIRRKVKRLLSEDLRRGLIVPGAGGPR